MLNPRSVSAASHIHTKICSPHISSIHPQIEVKGEQNCNFLTAFGAVVGDTSAPCCHPGRRGQGTSQHLKPMSPLARQSPAAHWAPRGERPARSCPADKERPHQQPRAAQELRYEHTSYSIGSARPAGSNAWFGTCGFEPHGCSHRIKPAHSSPADQPWHSNPIESQHSAALLPAQENSGLITSSLQPVADQLPALRRAALCRLQSAAQTHEKLPQTPKARPSRGDQLLLKHLKTFH